MVTYTIKVKNKSDEIKQYALFQAPPAKSPVQGTVWSNVWMKTPTVNFPNGSTTVTITEDIFAICGLAKAQLADGVYVSQSDYAEPIVLATSTTGGTKPTCHIVANAPIFKPKPYGTTSKSNSFGIHMDPYSKTTYPFVTIGLGKYNAKGEVVPALVFQPSGNVDYDITPQKMYYVASSLINGQDYKQGDVADITAYAGAVAINFTTAPAGMTQATITEKEDGSWDGPVYGLPDGPDARPKVDGEPLGPAPANEEPEAE